jgi:hypothetical protein
LRFHTENPRMRFLLKCANGWPVFLLLPNHVKHFEFQISRRMRNYQNGYNALIRESKSRDTEGKALVVKLFSIDRAEEVESRY